MILNNANIVESRHVSILISSKSYSPVHVWLSPVVSGEYNRIKMIDRTIVKISQQDFQSGASSKFRLYFANLSLPMAEPRSPAPLPRSAHPRRLLLASRRPPRLSRPRVRVSLAARRPTPPATAPERAFCETCRRRRRGAPSIRRALARKRNSRPLRGHA